MYSLFYVNRIVLAMFFMSGGDVAKLFLFGICALNYCGIKTEASLLTGKLFFCISYIWISDICRVESFIK